MIVELSTGHVFESESVKAITPIVKDGYYRVFEVIGVGYRVTIAREFFKEECFKQLHDEFVEKLLKGNQNG